MNLIERLIANYNDDAKLTPGISLAVIKNGNCFYKESFGYGNLENRVEINSESNFYLASVSKTFTGAAIMILLKSKLLKLEDSITKYLEDLPEFCDPITIQHLLNHTSGLEDYFINFYEKGILNDKTNDDVYKLVKNFDKLEFPIGSKYKYSNTGYTLLSMIIEQISKQSFEDFLKENIFQPTGMKSTYVYTKDKPIIPNRVYAYRKLSDVYSCDDYSLLTYGDGGIYSNVEDLIAWSNVLDSETILSHKYKDIMFARGTINSGQEIGYGCGWFTETLGNRKIVYHTGGAYGFRTFLGKVLDDDLSVVILTNCIQRQWNEISNNIPKFMQEIEELY